jgi:hypothetical protein
MRPLAALLLICGLTFLALAGAVVWFAAGWRTGAGLGAPPPIARNMYPMAGSFSPSWSRRLSERFPVGSPEREAIRVLKHEGFQVDAVRRFAGYGWARYPCVYTLTVNWRADAAGRVRAIQGGLLNACTRPDRLMPERRPRRLPGGPAEPALVPGAQSA